MKKLLSVLLVTALVLAALPLTALPALAGTSGDIEYVVRSGTDKTCEIFRYTGSATALEIPSELDGYTVTSIGLQAFSGCTSLTSITIPNSVTSIGEAAFSGCTALTEIKVDTGNPNYTSESGVLFNRNKTALICYPAGKQDSSYIVPNSVTSIGDYAFYDCTALTSITIPNSVTSIDWYAFSRCIALTNITIPDSVTSIGYGAFHGCTALTSITIPDSVTSIGYEAFRDCTSLTGITIPNSVTSIGVRAFYGCTALESITIPDSVTIIYGSTFSGCTSLTSITIPDSVTGIAGDAFDNTAYYNDATHWENDVLYIGNHLIEAKDTLSGAYTVRAGTKTIADMAFSDCTALTSITIPNSVTSISDGAFENCTALTNITIPNSVTSIGDDTFSGCTALESITIPNSVTSIGYEAFCDSTALTNITIPDSVTSIDNAAFYNTAYYNDATHWENDVLYIGNHLIEAKDTLSGTYTVRAGTKTIADDAFYDCTALTSVTIPNSVTSIGYEAFLGCTSLTSITIPNSVTGIGDGAFYDCTSLTSITIPDSVTRIGGDAFYNTAYYNDSTHWENDVLYIGNHLIEANDTLSGACTVRAGTKTIADWAFSDCTALETITIPNSVTSIGDCAFSGCTSLTSITIPNSVIEIGLWAFSGCTLLTTIYGYTGSYAETYATEYGYTFVALQKLTDAETGVSVLEGNFGNFAENTVLNVEKLSAEENTITYDITLTVNDEIVQPASAVTVKIPVPAGMDGTQCKVYREETNGKMTNMQATYQNGYMVFTTDHFSTYILTTKRLGICLGDLNGDDKINAVDARWVLQAASGARTFDAAQTAAADVNGDGKVNAVDARWILQIASGSRTV